MIFIIIQFSVFFLITALTLLAALDIFNLGLTMHAIKAHHFMPGGHWPRKGIWGCASPIVRKGLILSKRVSSQDPFWENLEILASTASIFTQILAHKPPNLEIFSPQAPKFGNFQFTSPSFQRQISVRKPHTSEIRAAHPYLKKVECPLPGFMHFDLASVFGIHGSLVLISWITPLFYMKNAKIDSHKNNYYDHKTT